MQLNRSQTLKNILLYLFFMAFYLLGKLVIPATWPSQSAISPEKASSLFTGLFGVVVSLFGIGGTWSKSNDGIYRGGVWARWFFILGLMLFAGFILITWNTI